MTPWLSARDLLDLLRQGVSVRLVDVRSSLADKGAGRRAYEAGHLPGAVFLDLETDLSDPVAPHGGRHPLPAPARIAEVFGGIGVGSDTWVVAYDAGDAMTAGRVWWLLRSVGHDRMRVLDGGLPAWLAAGGEVTQVVPAHPAVAFTPRPVPDQTVDRAWLRDHLRDPNVVVLDARAAERYRGEVEPIDPRAGHIPGAVNRPFAAHLADGRFRPLDELAPLYRDLLDGKRAIATCGSGVSAAHTLMVLEALGIRGARLYPGSWSDWVSYADAPIATGADPG